MRLPGEDRKDTTLPLKYRSIRKKLKGEVITDQVKQMDGDTPLTDDSAVTPSPNVMDKE
jgi:hypothetical protein